jgi:lipopolysaccharide/colanic/teichoic acid biosynthesis glycosyltransferase
MLAVPEPRSRYVAKQTPRPALRIAYNLWLPRATWYAPLKAALDLAGALFLLILSAPVILVAAVLVKLTSRGPAFYMQTRLGQHGSLFTIYKLRTMTHNCERVSGVCWSNRSDPRVTRLGRFLRASHIDELPQLWNVLKGDMSLVGPRPERPEFLPKLESALPFYRCRLMVRPGLTGMAQVQLPPDSDLKSVRRKLAHDLHYVRNNDLWMDVQILLATAAYLIKLPLAWVRTVLQMPGGATLEYAYEYCAVTQVQPRPTLSVPAFASPTYQLEVVVAS